MLELMDKNINRADPDQEAGSTLFVYLQKLPDQGLLCLFIEI